MIQIVIDVLFTQRVLKRVSEWERESERQRTKECAAKLTPNVTKVLYCYPPANHYSESFFAEKPTTVHRCHAKKKTRYIDQRISKINAMNLFVIFPWIVFHTKNTTGDCYGWKWNWFREPFRRNYNCPTNFTVGFNRKKSINWRKKAIYWFCIINYKPFSEILR